MGGEGWGEWLRPLDTAGQATAKTVAAVADLVALLAQGVRGARQAAE